MSHRVSVIEDNQDLAQSMKLHLTDAGSHVDAVHDSRAGLARATHGGFSLVVLDLMLSGIDGLEICRDLRTAESYVPIPMLRSKPSELDRAPFGSEKIFLSFSTPPKVRFFCLGVRPLPTLRVQHAF